MKQDNRTEQEKITSIHQSVDRAPNDGLIGQLSVAISAGLRKYEVTNLMPKVVETTPDYKPGHRVVIENRDKNRHYRMINRPTIKSLEHARNTFRAGMTSVERSIDELDMEGTGPILKGAIATARTLTAALRSTVEQSINLAVNLGEIANADS